MAKKQIFQAAFGLALLTALIGLAIVSPAAQCLKCTQGHQPPTTNYQLENGRYVVNVYIDPSWGTPPPDKFLNAFNGALNNWNDADDGPGRNAPYIFFVTSNPSEANVTVKKVSAPCGEPAAWNYACATYSGSGTLPQEIQIKDARLNSSNREIDMQGDIAHELGHMMGLHSVQCGASIMQPMIGDTGVGQTNTVQPADVAKTIDAASNPGSCDGVGRPTFRASDGGGGGGGGGPECGNNSCEAGEDENNCPQDCSSGGGGGSCGPSDCGCPATSGCEQWCDDHFGECNCTENLYSNPDSWWICNYLCGEAGIFGDCSGGEPDLDCNGQCDQIACNEMFGPCLLPTPEPTALWTNSNVVAGLPLSCGLGVLVLLPWRRRSAASR